MGRAMKAVQKIDLVTGEVVGVYGTVTAAAKSVNGTKGNISSVCCGRTKKAYGFTWRFTDVELIPATLDVREWISNPVNARKALIWISEMFGKENDDVRESTD